MCISGSLQKSCRETMQKRGSTRNRWLFLKSTTTISRHNLNHISNPHLSTEAEKRDELKQISNSHGGYFNSARINFFDLSTGAMNYDANPPMPLQN